MWLEFAWAASLCWRQVPRTVALLDIDISPPACIVSDDPSSCLQGVLDRFSQIQPKLIFSVEAVIYNGKEHSHLEKLQRVVKGTRSVGVLSRARAQTPAGPDLVHPSSRTA